MSTTSRRYLIVGATGKQGGAVIDALIRANPDPPISILALTRNTSSPAAQSLASKPNVTLLQGDLSSPSAIFSSSPDPIHAIFSAQVPDMRRKNGTDTEVTQGCALIDAAISHGVRHFVYSSVDRGGAASSSSPTPVPHFQSKHAIEQHLFSSVVTAAAKSSSTNNNTTPTMTYTVLRPTAFMDNLSQAPFSYIFGALWATVDPKPLQLISTHSIGLFAASTLLHPDRPAYHNAALTLVGDELTQKDANAIFQKVVDGGRSMPQTFGFVVRTMCWLMGDIGKMVEWFRDPGYGGSVEECRRVEPEVQGFEQWLRESSGYVK
ncbi:MAG: hypothetical protein Q9227_000462 [Pyrenula ochraceoflavens]